MNNIFTTNIIPQKGRFVNMAKLYEISEQFSELFGQLEDTEDMTDEERSDFEQAWFDTLEAIEGEFEAKAENIALYIKECTALADALKSEKKRIDARQKAAENRAAGLKTYLKTCMEQMNLKKVETARAKISVRSTAPALKITDEGAFVAMLQENGRDDLLKWSQPEIRKTEVKNLIKSGEHFDGAELVAGQCVVIG